jgi:phage shock protein A
MKTREEIEHLKNNWRADPCYEIEETEGFEEYRDELLEFRRKTEEEWSQRAAEAKRKDEAVLYNFASNLRITDYPDLAMHLFAEQNKRVLLEVRVEALEEKLAQANFTIDNQRKQFDSLERSVRRLYNDRI